MPKDYRRCLSCRKIAPKSEFWRIVRVYPSRNVELDWGNGRSAYVCPNADCLKLAEQKKRLGKALKANIPDSIYQTLRERLSLVRGTSVEIEEDAL
jgi:uncharacterized protein